MKKSTKRIAKPVKTAKPAIEVVRELPKVRLDLGAGQSPREGFEGVDKYAPNARHQVDLFKFPFPWKDNSVDEIHCSHFLEHLPAREVEARDLSDPKATRFIGKDFLFAFMDECWRILKPEAMMRIIVPNATSTRAFQDPTHRRFFPMATFYYFWKQWRIDQKLGHYPVDCDFGCVSLVPIIPVEESLHSPEVQQRRFNECWNIIQDWQADLVAKK